MRKQHGTDNTINMAGYDIFERMKKWKQFLDKTDTSWKNRYKEESRGSSMKYHIHFLIKNL